MVRQISLLLILAALAATACAPAVPAAAGKPGPGEVSISSFAFSPASLTVAAGATVSWSNDDPVAHTVASDSSPPSFDSGRIASGAGFSWTFMTPGIYRYHCAYHPSMTGTIEVTE